MKCKSILCLGFKGHELTAEAWAQINELGDKCTLLQSLKGRSLNELIKVDCLLVKLGARIDKEFIDRLPNLRYIGMLGTGYGGIDTTYAAGKGIIVTNIADYATEAVAEFSFGILLEQMRDIVKAKQQAKAGNYTDNFLGSEIKGKKFGVIGLGNIGTRTAQLAQAFGADVSYWSRNRKESIEAQGINYCELDTLLANCDIITLNLALNVGTLGIINEARAKLIKKQALFINTSPMELLDFEALVRRLKRADMTFLLDHSDEMTVQQLKILRTLDNCLIYPPIAYLSREGGELKRGIYVDNLKNFLAGRPTNSVA